MYMTWKIGVKKKERKEKNPIVKENNENHYRGREV